MHGLRSVLDADRLIFTGIVLALAGCGDDGGSSTTDASTSGATDATTITTGTSSTTTTGTSDGTGTSASGTTTGATTATTGATDSTSGTTTGATDSASGSGSTGAVTGPKFDLPIPDVAPEACSCSQDLQTVLDCQENVLETCVGDQGCNPMTLACENACDVAAANKQSVGCEYHAVFMEQATPSGQSGCFAVYVANTWDTAANLVVEYDGQTLPIQAHAGIPQGSGLNLTWDPYDAGTGLPAGEVVVLFLSAGPQAGNDACPIAPAVPSGVMLQGTGKAKSFKISADVPVVAYEMNPYGGGDAATTGASLLLPTSAWGTNYIAANAYFGGTGSGPGRPQLNIIANEDNTFVTLYPVADIIGGGGVPGTTAGVATAFTLNAGEHAQIIQQDANGDMPALTGSVIDSTKPVGLLGGDSCNFAPAGGCCCDHSEQMIPPVTALGNKFVSVMHRPRMSEPAIYHVVGVVDGTNLTYSNAVGGPATLDRGEVVEFITSVPFVVESQGDTHPFMTFILMSGGRWDLMDPACGMETDEAACDAMTNCAYSNSDNKCYPGAKGDADFVYVVPAEQYARRYTFFADPTYPDSNLVMVRARQDGTFHPVTLDCLGEVQNWTPVGNDYEWARFDLSSGDFVDNGNCSTGRHEISSDAPFGLTVWGWGDKGTTPDSRFVSYGYPAGMQVVPINGVYVPPQG